MILICPNCNANFRLEQSVLGTEGRKVKCSKCNHRWHALPEMAEREVANSLRAESQAAKEINDADPFADLHNSDNNTNGSSSEDEKAVSDNANLLSARPDSSSGPTNISERKDGDIDHSPAKPVSRFMKWFMVLLLPIVALLGVMIFRAEIVRFYPPIEKFLQFIDMSSKPLGYGLKLINTTSKPKIEGENSIIIISGEIENTLAVTLDMPLLKGDFYDNSGKVIFTHKFQAASPKILPGEKVNYQTNIKNPPSGSVRIEITFTEK